MMHISKDLHRRLHLDDKRTQLPDARGCSSCVCAPSEKRSKGLRPIVFVPRTLWRTWGTLPGGGLCFIRHLPSLLQPGFVQSLHEAVIRQHSNALESMLRDGKVLLSPP